MPSLSKKQHNFMAAVAHNAEFAKKAGVPQSVGKDFNDADRGRKFKGGGDVKETKEIADAEMKALKRGHAPKKILEHERKEHKDMGYKEGGKVHRAEVPHEETKQKGFGMGDKSKPGRSVTKSPKPHEETKQKGFGMKKGGMAKGGRAKPKTPGLPPALMSALAGTGGPPMGGAPPAGPPGMGPPGMKKGGNVIMHHHHYAKGGHVKDDTKEESGKQQELHHNRERVPHKEKKVKMASGGRVGTRGDGIAQRGHTRVRIC
jgi:hypothetical protein